MLGSFSAWATISFVDKPFAGDKATATAGKNRPAIVSHSPRLTPPSWATPKAGNATARPATAAAKNLLYLLIVSLQDLGSVIFLDGYLLRHSVVDECIDGLLGRHFEVL